jgi:hypothetical protein
VVLIKILRFPAPNVPKSREFCTPYNLKTPSNPHYRQNSKSSHIYYFLISEKILISSRCTTFLAGLGG